MKKFTYEHTIISGFICFFIQALVCNFMPLLFITLQQEFHLSIVQITSLITINFIVQLLTDILATTYIKIFGVKGSVLVAHSVAFLGFVALAFLPFMFKNAYFGLLISITFMAIGAGLIEVLISPIIEACPTKNKSGTMSLLHSFFCWGSVFVILLSTIYFNIFSITSWQSLSLLWALLPLANGILFAFVPIVKIEEPDHHISALFKNKLFWILLVIMVCAGACELSMSQWTSTFVESALGVSKQIGDLVGPCLFVFAMGVARVYYSKNSGKIHLTSFMLRCTVLCTICYIIVGITNNAFIALFTCMICGFSVGIFWPGTLSIASFKMDSVTPSMFAFLAIAGDLGCILGPTITGVVYEWTGLLQSGFLVSSIFPFILCIALLFSKKYHNCHTH